MDVSLGIGTTGSHVPHKSLIRLRAAYMPDAARPAFRLAPELVPGDRPTPGFDIIWCISTLHRRFLALASSDHTCRDHVLAFAATLTTVAFDDRSLQWFETNT
ncbi:MAG TPA: hypothetical protein VMG63_01985 [Terriglobia bacterium]|nr:hypothetical protein [Terriglobia bacterium]